MDRAQIERAIQRELRRWDGIDSQKELQAAAPRMAAALAKVAVRASRARSQRESADLDHRLVQ